MCGIGLLLIDAFHCAIISMALLAYHWCLQENLSVRATVKSSPRLVLDMAEYDVLKVIQ